jgi:LacI family transcriptional regulator
MRDRKITIRDVADAAGVSVATVSRALSSPGQVSVALRDRVARAADRLGYVVDGAARALASRRSHAMGALFPTLDNPIFAACIDAFQRRLDAAGYSLLVASAGYDAAREARELRTLLERGVDGVMLIGAEHAEASWALLRRGTPAVLTWTHEAPLAGLPCIGFDNRAAARRVAAHLLGLGHRRIAMIAGVTDGNDRAAARVAGVRDALAAAGVPLDRGNLTERSYTVADGHAAVVELLARTPPPTAVICGNDHLALGAIAGARARGVEVPGQLSVTGFDDLDFAAFAAPPLTTVQVPAAEMGRRAADHLVALAAGKPALPTVELEAPLVLRETTGRVDARAAAMA